MTTIQNLILDNLLATTPDMISVTPAPYDPIYSAYTQILQVYRCMQYTIHMKNRILSLAYAYYLGELLENITDRAQQSYLSKQLSKYHLSVCRRTFGLFEKSGIEQIWRTKHTTLTMISKLKFSDYQLIISD